MHNAALRMEISAKRTQQSYEMDEPSNFDPISNLENPLLTDLYQVILVSNVTI